MRLKSKNFAFGLAAAVAFSATTVFTHWPVDSDADRMQCAALLAWVMAETGLSPEVYYCRSIYDPRRTSDHGGVLESLKETARLTAFCEDAAAKGDEWWMERFEMT